MTTGAHDNGFTVRERLRRSVTIVRSEIQDANVPRSLIHHIRPALPALARRITAQIQGEVTEYAGGPTGRRRRLIEMAVTGAITQFVDLVEGTDTGGRRVDELFRQMGHGEATDGHDLTVMQSALDIAMRDAWMQLRDFTIEHDLSAAVLGRLGDLLIAYIDHLAEQTRAGFTAGQRGRKDVGDTARARLIEGLLAGHPPIQVRAMAGTALWPLPVNFVVAAVTAPDGPPAPPELTDPDAGWLTGVVDSVRMIVGAPDHVAAALAVVARLAPEARSAVTWPLALEDVRSAKEWTHRALDLVARGVIPDQPVIHCVEHRTQLWLHAEPALRQRLVQDLVRPLLAETPNSREILSETLLAWLESRDSAPAIAARLGVHPQTVRYRWKRINELFGESLHEPEFVVQMTMLLKASVPLWKAGDQSDFERFRAEDGR